jgi:hypothetical protein
LYWLDRFSNEDITGLDSGRPTEIQEVAVRIANEKATLEYDQSLAQ